MKTLLFLLLCSSALAYTTPPGIPQPLWGALDPVNAAPPAQPGAWPAAEAAGYYYIDNTDPAATNTANTYGYPDKPRTTIPEGTWAAGSYVEIHGGPYNWAAGDSEFDVVAAGSEASPVWLLFEHGGVKTEIRGMMEVSGTYVIIDGFHSTVDPGNRQAEVGIGGDTNTGSYICVRNFYGEGTATTTSAGSYCNILGTTGNEVSNVVIYNGEITKMGQYAYAVSTAELDHHAVLPGQYCNNVWVLAVHAHSNGGDGIQSTGNNASGEARTQYLYVGDCEFNENGENAIDLKSVLDVVISRNNFHTVADSIGSDGTAIVVQTENGGGCDNVWVLFNRIHDCVKPIRSEETATSIYAIGNLFYDLVDGDATGAPEDGYSGAMIRAGSGGALHLIDNSFIRYQHHGHRWKGVGTGPVFTSSGNLFHGRTEATGYDIWGQTVTSGTFAINRNLYPASARFFYTSTYTSLAAWQSGNPQAWDANSLSADSGVAVPDGDNFNLLSTSPAIGANTEHAAYAAFLSRYSLSIAYDFNGNSRPQGGSWDIGALEFVNVQQRSSSLRKSGNTSQ